MSACQFELSLIRSRPRARRKSKIAAANRSSASSLGCGSVGGTHPYRVHMRDPSFVNLQAIPAMAEGALLADVIAGGASLDPVMGGCDR